MKVVVVGGGVIGLSTAWYLSESGHDVTVIDRGHQEHENCSYGNAGYVTPSHFVPLASPGMVSKAIKWMFNPESPFYVKPRLDPDLISWGWRFNRAATKERVDAAAPVLRDLNVQSREEYERLSKEWDDEFRLIPRGIMTLNTTEKGLEHEKHIAATSNRLGVPAEVLTREDVAKLEPGIRIDVLGGVLFPTDAVIAPGLFLRALIRRLKDRGVDLKWQTEVVGWKKAGERIAAVRTSAGDVSADEFVVCGGSWSPSVVKDLGIKLPLQAGKGYSLTLPNPPARTTRGIIVAEARVAVTPMGDAMRFGGTMEIAGIDEGINPARIRGIVKSACRYFPDYKPSDFEGIKPWAGLRPCSPDGLPYIGRFRDYANLSVGTGHAMMGLSLGPVTGKLIAEVLSGAKPSVALDAVSPDRYA